MNFDIPAALIGTPDRLSALLLNLEDADIDAEIQEAIEDTGLFEGLTGAELAKQRYLYRFRLFSEDLLDIISDEDGTTEARRARRTARTSNRTFGTGRGTEARARAWALFGGLPD